MIMPVKNIFVVLAQNPCSAGHALGSWRCFPHGCGAEGKLCYATVSLLGGSPIYHCTWKGPRVRIQSEACTNVMVSALSVKLNIVS